MKIDMDEVKEAARLLVVAEDAVDLYEMLAVVIRRVGNLPVKLTGKYAQLNPLLDLYREDREVYDTVVGWVVDKRKQRELEPLRDEKALNKNEYMREFMFELRARWRKAVEIENMLRSEKDKLKGESRRAFEKKCSKEWAAQRDSLLDAERKRLGVEHLPRETMQQILKHFWEHVDRQLEDMEELTMAELRKPVYQRMSPQMSALKSALES